MSLVLSVNQLGTPRFLLRNRSASSHVQQNRTVFTRRHYRGKKELNVPRFRGEVYRVRSFKSTEGSKEVSSEKSLENDQWLLLQAWDVPWDWKIILYVMMPYLMSILLTGIVESAGLGVMQPHAENVTPHLHGTDEEAIRLFLDELLKTAVKLSVLYVFVSPYQPFPDNVFSYRWHQPFNIQNGWLLWGIGGLVAASSVVFLIKSFISGPDANQIQNEQCFLTWHPGNSSTTL